MSWSMKIKFTTFYNSLKCMTVQLHRCCFLKRLIWASERLYPLLIEKMRSNVCHVANYRFYDPVLVSRMTDILLTVVRMPTILRYSILSSRYSNDKLEGLILSMLWKYRLFFFKCKFHCRKMSFIFIINIAFLLLLI